MSNQHLSPTPEWIAVLSPRGVIVIESCNTETIREIIVGPTLADLQKKLADRKIDWPQFVPLPQELADSKDGS